jgi:hypothetical protein
VDELHERLLRIGFDAGEELGLVLAGGYALEALGAHHTAGFSLDELADRLGAIGERDERGFAAYGLTETDIIRLRQWAIAWESDIRRRLAAGETGPTGLPDNEWDSYLDHV